MNWSDSTIKTNIRANIADIQESLSDFNSCVESSGEGSGSSDDDCDTLKVDKKGEPKSLNDRKCEKKFKRKLVLTPSKEDFFKKPNRDVNYVLVDLLTVNVFIKRQGLRLLTTEKVRKPFLLCFALILRGIF